MTRTFKHQFDPAALSPAPYPGDIELTVQEIEAAGIAELLQRSGAKVSSWSLLEALLEPAEARFRFREPLGAAREVKVAASGLFGRFVARAYLTRYLKMAFFENLGTKPVTLNKRLRLEIRRKRGSRFRGDLPDWVACTQLLRNITIAEAKGCHDKPGPKNALKRAWAQAARVDVVVGARRLSVKRIAIATRWASKTGGSADPIIGVRDPLEEGDPDTEQYRDDAGVGLARIHVANLLEPLGYSELAHSIRGTLAQGQLAHGDASALNARKALADARPREVQDDANVISGEIGPLVGAYMTRAGPLTRADISPGTVEILRSYGLRPMFVGIEREVVEAVITGDPQLIRRASGRKNPVRSQEIFADFSGTCIAYIGGGTRVA